MAHKKGGGSTRNGRDSKSKRLGFKRGDGDIVLAGTILVRQRGTRIHAGKGVMRGGDDTLFAGIEGQVKYHSGLKGRKFVSVLQAAYGSVQIFTQNHFLIVS